MRKGKKVFAALLLLFVANTLMAQSETYTLKGNLKDANDGAMMPYTNCVLLHSTDSVFAYGVTSDDKGAFCFKGIEGGFYLLRISCVGYETHWQHVDIHAEKSMGTFKLTPISTSLNEIQITASRPIYSADGEKTLYNVDDDPSVQTGSASDALQNAPGVEVNAEGKISFRGGSNIEVWINDKPSHMDAESLKQYLKMMPAGNIKRIEVISNPSARYKTKGSIINIVTNQQVTHNRMLSAGINASTSPMLSPWISYVWSDDRQSLNFYADIELAREISETNLTSQILTPDSLISNHYDYVGQQFENGRQAFVGAEYTLEIDTLTDLSAWLEIYPRLASGHSSIDAHRTEYIYTPGVYNYHSDIDSRSFFIGSTGGVWWSHRFDTLGRKLDLSIDAEMSSTNGTRHHKRTFATTPQLNFMRQETNLHPEIWGSLNVNYSHPYSKKGLIETGVFLGTGTDVTDLVADTISRIDSLYYNEAVRSYQLKNNGFFASAYLTAQHRFGPFTVKVGLRAENDWIALHYPSAPDFDLNRSYFSLSPSVHFSYSTKNMHNFTLSYTRRVSNPEGSQIAHFKVLADDSFSTGSPDLRQSFTHNMEAGWTKYFDRLGSIGVASFYRASVDEIGTLTDVAWHDYYGRLVDFTQAVNIGTTKSKGLELNATIRPADFMNIRFYAMLFDDYYKVQFRTNKWIENEMISYSVRLNFWTKLWKVLQVYVNADYRSRRQDVLVVNEPNWGVDCGLVADLFDRRLSLYLNANDIFKSRSKGTGSLNPYHSSSYNYSFNSRYISLGLTWRIGRMELEEKASQSRVMKQH